MWLRAHRSNPPRAAVLASHVAPEVEHALLRWQPRAQHFDRDLGAAATVEALDGDRRVVHEVVDAGGVERREHRRLQRNFFVH